VQYTFGEIGLNSNSEVSRGALQEAQVDSGYNRRCVKLRTQIRRSFHGGVSPNLRQCFVKLRCFADIHSTGVIDCSGGAVCNQVKRLISQILSGWLTIEEKVPAVAQAWPMENYLPLGLRSGKQWVSLLCAGRRRVRGWQPLVEG